MSKLCTCVRQCRERDQLGLLSAVVSTILVPETSFVEDDFTELGQGRWFEDDSSILCALFLLLLHQLHLRSIGIRSSLGIPALEEEGWTGLMGKRASVNQGGKYGSGSNDGDYQNQLPNSVINIAHALNMSPGTQALQLTVN